MSSTTQEVVSIDPVSGERWATFAPSSPADVEAAVAAAHRAQPRWAETPIRDRANLIERFRKRLIAEKSRVSQTIVRETGKPPGEALFEVYVSAELARFAARRAPRVLRTRRFRSSNLAIWRKRVELAHEPLGVVGIITPWNYPLVLSCSPVLSALVAGNTVVFKPSELTPSTAAILTELLIESGIPEGAIHLVQGAGATGAALVGSDLDKVFFTGSDSTGRNVAARCAERMTPCVLELGGSDPAIVLEDADPRHAARGIAWGRFSNSGQTCVAPKRAIVVDAIYERFVEEMQKRVSALQAGVDVGPLIRPIQRERIERQLEDALDKGARIVAQGSRSSGGSWFPPTLLVDVTQDMKVMTEETFGPILPVLRVRDADEAIAAANASRYGLSASIWSADTKRARRLARRIEGGAVTINDSLIIAGLADVPYGGTKSSGNGRMHGAIGLLEFTRTKSFVIDPFSSWAESYWDTTTEAATRGIEAFVDLTHGSGVMRRLRAAFRVVRDLYLKPGGSSGRGR